MIRLTRSTSVRTHVRVLPQPGLPRQLAREQLHGAPDGAERIADLVGEAHGHPARRRQGLAAPNLRLELPQP